MRVYAARLTEPASTRRVGDRRSRKRNGGEKEREKDLHAREEVRICRARAR